MSARKFCILVFGILGLFVFFNIVLWQICTKDIFYGEENTVLQRMGGMSFSPPKNHPVNYPVKHHEFRDIMDTNLEGIQVDVVTIGDSFSNGSGGNYYQDYLCSQYGWKVLNIPSKPYNNALQMLYILQDTGALDKMRPKIIILESLAANMGERFGGDVVERPVVSMTGFKQAQSQGNITNKMKNEISANKIAPEIMLKYNMVVLKTTVHRKLYPNDYRINDGVGNLRLKKQMFSNEGWEDALVVPLSDCNVHFSEHIIKNINANLNKVAKQCRDKGILLVFMSAANKVDVYYPYIKEVPSTWRSNTSMQELEALPKEYVFVNTEKILQQALVDREEEDIRDLYWLGDLHFSWKANQIVGDWMAKELGKYILSN